MSLSGTCGWGGSVCRCDRRPKQESDHDLVSLYQREDKHKQVLEKSFWLLPGKQMGQKTEGGKSVKRLRC